MGVLRRPEDGISVAGPVYVRMGTLLAELKFVRAVRAFVPHGSLRPTRRESRPCIVLGWPNIGDEFPRNLLWVEGLGYHPNEDPARFRWVPRSLVQSPMPRNGRPGEFLRWVTQCRQPRSSA